MPLGRYRDAQGHLWSLNEKEGAASGYEFLGPENRDLAAVRLPPQKPPTSARERREARAREAATTATAVAEEEESEFPKHVGGGTFELSNGERIRGKEEAIEAEAALKEE